MTQTNQHPKNTAQSPHTCQSPRFEGAGYIVGIGFLIVAIGLVMIRSTPAIPLGETPEVKAEQIIPGARRVALTDPPMISIGTLNQRCSDCHLLFENIRPPDRPLTQHTHINLQHGSNDACLNCHDKDDREKLTVRGKDPVGFGNVEQLCAQCHGPIYRDWIKGTHGKTIGYWNAEFGPSTKLVCTQCHDPHHPAYDPIEPLPGPHTLRMGDKHSGHHGDMIDERNPLQRWRLLENTNDTENTNTSSKSNHGSEHK